MKMKSLLAIQWIVMAAQFHPVHLLLQIRFHRKSLLHLVGQKLQLRELKNHNLKHLMIANYYFKLVYLVFFSDYLTQTNENTITDSSTTTTTTVTTTNTSKLSTNNTPIKTPKKHDKRDKQTEESMNITPSTLTKGTTSSSTKKSNKKSKKKKVEE
mmetsp:Transcript_18136/g.18195  ORF Transcript_18136/g.18195 Transcript_18136/m.18195 type:complete len:156 (+) Transcript_18136:1044-1511(+)